MNKPIYKKEAVVRQKQINHLVIEELKSELTENTRIDRCEIGKRVKKIRREILGFSTAEFALLLNVSIETVYQWERTKAVVPNLEIAKKIAYLGNMTVDKLLYG